MHFCAPIRCAKTLDRPKLELDNLVLLDIFFQELIKKLDQLIVEYCLHQTV